MAPQSREPSNSHSDEPGKPLKHDQSAEIARQTAEYVASHGPVETQPHRPVTVESIKAERNQLGIHRKGSK